MAVYDTLNKPQKEAVFHTEGLAFDPGGSGFGKTRVLTHRIAYLIEEKGAESMEYSRSLRLQIKRRKQMRQRVDSLLSGSEQRVFGSVRFISETIYVSS